jgi:hypothetical protein
MISRAAEAVVPVADARVEGEAAMTGAEAGAVMMIAVADADNLNSVKINQGTVEKPFPVFD